MSLIVLSSLLTEHQVNMLMTEEFCSKMATDWRNWRRVSNEIIVLALRMYSRVQSKPETVNFIHEMVYRTSKSLEDMPILNLQMTYIQRYTILWMKLTVSGFDWTLEYKYK